MGFSERDTLRAPLLADSVEDAAFDPRAFVSVRLFRLVRWVRRHSQAGYATDAVVLIALVGSSALFASTTLEAGTFMADQLSELTSRNVRRVSGSLEVGSVLVTAESPFVSAESIQFTLSFFGSSEPLALSADSPGGLLISYRDQSTYAPSVPYSSRRVTGDADAFMEAGERYLITVYLKDIAGAELTPGAGFSLELAAPFGVPLELNRTIPGALQTFTKLY